MRGLSVVVVLVAVGCGRDPTAVCVDYVACAEAVGSSADLTKYLPDGECWADADASRVCSEECQSEVEDLARYNGDEACAAYGAPLAEGSWTLTLTADPDPCRIDGTTTHGNVTYDPDNGRFSWGLTVAPTLACTWFDETFSCTTPDGEKEWTFDGRGRHDSATGTWTFREGPCSGNGAFTGTLD